MTGNVALDIFIGLIFIYLLYSLLATVLLEIITTNLNIRAANLKRAVYRMLNDDKEGVKPRVRLWWAIASLIGKGFSQKNGGLAKEVFNSNGIRYLGSRGLFKSGPSNISASQFSKAILGAFADTNGRTNAEGIQNYLSNEGDRESSNSGIEYLKFLFGQAQGDIENFTLKIEEWYDEMMLVATEWYKKRMQIWLFIIGLVMANSLNVNTLYLAKVLSVDKNARAEMLQLATTYLENTDSLKDLNGLTKEELESYKKEVQDQIEQSRNIIGLPDMPATLRIKDASCTPEEFRNHRKETDSYLETIDGNYILFEQPQGWKYLNFGRFINPHRITDEIISAGQVQLSTNSNFLQRLLNWNWDWNRFRLRMYRWLGAILTALAISLGAPFWFDLLNKVMQLRGAVSQKKTAQQVQATSSSTLDNTKG